MSSDFEKRWFKDVGQTGEPQKCWICGASLPGNKLASHWTSSHPEAAAELDGAMKDIGKALKKLVVGLLLVPVIVIVLYLTWSGVSTILLLMFASTVVGMLLIAIMYMSSVVPARMLEKHRRLWSESHSSWVSEKRK